MVQADLFNFLQGLDSYSSLFSCVHNNLYSIVIGINELNAGSCTAETNNHQSKNKDRKLGTLNTDCQQDDSGISIELHHTNPPTGL
jgi:hypothetical protein